MWIIYFLLILIILLLFVIIKSSILSFAFKILVNEEVENKKFILPITLSLASFIIFNTLAYLVLVYRNIPIYETFSRASLNLDYSYSTLTTIIIAFILGNFLYITAHSFILKLVYFPFNKKDISLQLSEINTTNTPDLKDDENEEINSDVHIRVNSTDFLIVGETKNIEDEHEEKEADLTTSLNVSRLSFVHGIAISLFSFAVAFVSLILLTSIGMRLGQSLFL